MNKTMKPCEWLKVIVHGENGAELGSLNEHLEGALKNWLWGKRYFEPPVRLLKQHNRDIYYVCGQGDISTLDRYHLDDDERANILEIELSEILGRLGYEPEWWPDAVIWAEKPTKDTP